jgi:hypothetical protein
MVSDLRSKVDKIKIFQECLCYFLIAISEGRIYSTKSPKHAFVLSFKLVIFTIALFQKIKMGISFICPTIDPKQHEK